MSSIVSQMKGAVQIVSHPKYSQISRDYPSMSKAYFWTTFGKRAEEDLGQRWLHVRGSQGNHRVVRPAPCEMSDFKAPCRTLLVFGHVAQRLQTPQLPAGRRGFHRGLPCTLCSTRARRASECTRSRSRHPAASPRSLLTLRASPRTTSSQSTVSSARSASGYCRCRSPGRSFRRSSTLAEPRPRNLHAEYVVLCA